MIWKRWHFVEYDDMSHLERERESFNDVFWFISQSLQMVLPYQTSEERPKNPNSMHI